MLIILCSSQLNTLQCVDNFLCSLLNFTAFVMKFSFPTGKKYLTFRKKRNIYIFSFYCFKICFIFRIQAMILTLLAKQSLHLRPDSRMWLHDWPSACRDRLTFGHFHGEGGNWLNWKTTAASPLGLFLLIYIHRIVQWILKGSDEAVIGRHVHPKFISVGFFF